MILADFSDTASTVANVATVLAALGGLCGAVWVWNSQRRERRVDQARRISAWPVEVSPLRDENEFGAVFGVTNRDRYHSVLVRARNGSESPVYDFCVIVRNSYLRDAGGIASANDPPRILPPGEHDLWVDLVEFPHGGLARFPLIDFSFRDENDRRWQRLNDGSLGRDRLSQAGREASFRGRWWKLVRAKRRLEHRLQRSHQTGVGPAGTMTGDTHNEAGPPPG